MDVGCRNEKLTFYNHYKCKTFLKTYLPVKSCLFSLSYRLFMVEIVHSVSLQKVLLKNFEDLLKKLVFLVRYLCWVDLQLSG